MFIQLAPLEFRTFLVLTIILITWKAVLASYLGLKMYQKAKESGSFTFGFVFSVFVLMACLLVSRMVYMIFDFHLTGFDASLYPLMPNIVFWKLASIISAGGYSIFLLVTDVKIFKFKFKGIFTFILWAFMVIQAVYPVSTEADFQVVSSFSLFSNLVAIVIPMLFFSMSRHKGPVRLPSLLIAFGVIIYAVGANLTVETLLAILVEAFGTGARISVYFISLVLKVTGLAMFSLGVTKFTLEFSKAA
ncbi:hypothetical protein GF325_11460 [Candidatus Bathyarchaeota archaeon]|nr:hypothetical protein [Candidatus Bathyarchaeota archaeon]